MPDGMLPLDFGGTGNAGTEAYEGPNYTYAGAGMGAESVVQCSLCGVLLRDSGTMTHTEWHYTIRKGE